MAHPLPINLSPMTPEKKAEERTSNEIISQQDEIIGRLTREVEDLRDTEQKRQEWLQEAKEKAGFNRLESFDNVWKKVFAGWLAGQKPEENELIKTLVYIQNTLGQLTVSQDSLEGRCYNAAEAALQKVFHPSPPTGEKAKSGEDQGKNWNRVVATIAAADICKNIKPGDTEELDNWKIEVIQRLSKQFIIHRKG